MRPCNAVAPDSQPIPHTARRSRYGGLRPVVAIAGKVVLIASLALLLLPALPVESRGNRTIGKEIYEERCILCHGAQGLGWDWGRKAEKPPVPVPNLVEVVPKRSDEYLVRIIKHGGGAVGLTPFMPAFGFDMQDQQVWDVVAYLRTLRDVPAPKPHSSLRKSRSLAVRYFDTVGRETYGERCVLCHGPRGRGWDWNAKADHPPVPVPNLVEVVPGRSDDYLVRIIKLGGGAVGLTPFMPAFGFNMHEQQVWDLVAYLRALSSPRGGPAVSLRGRSGMQAYDGYHAAAVVPPSRAVRRAWLSPVSFSPRGHGQFARAAFIPRDRLGAISQVMVRRRLELLLAHQGTHGGQPQPHGRRVAPQASKGPGHRTGFFPHAVAVGDFNNDGYPDLAVPAAGERKLAVLLGNGKAGIISNHSYPVGMGPTWVAAADLDKDGALDLITTNSGGGTLTLYYGDGKGGMRGRKDIQGIQGPSSVVAVDLNQDGYPDLAVSQAANSRVAVLINDTKGMPRLRKTMEVNRGPHILDSADLNADGIPDLIVGSLGTHTLTVLLGSKENMPTERVVVNVGRFPHYRVYGDFNGDGHQDVAVVAAGKDAVEILMGDGTGRLEHSASIAAGVNPHGMVGGDFNGDGNLDLAISNRSSRDIHVLLGAGNGKFAANPPIPTGQDVITLASADFDRDGILDLAMISASSNSVIFFKGDGKGNFHSVESN